MKLGTRSGAATLCETPEPRRPIAAIAHRGASCMAPENTLLAFQLALEAGVDAIETDARLTADGEIVLLSDEDDPQLRWRFTDITKDAFTWRGEISHDGGATFSPDEEMRITRQ